MSVRVRFAPSPTGHVHIGNIRAAIFNWLFARHEGGKFLLRVEDTDLERSTPEAIATLLDVMRWLKLDYDEEILYQSGQAPRHVEAARRMEQAGRAYSLSRAPGERPAIYFRIPFDAEALPCVRTVGAAGISVHAQTPVSVGPSGVRYAVLSKKGSATPEECCLAGLKDLRLLGAGGECLFDLATHAQAVLQEGRTFTVENVARMEFTRREIFFQDLVKGELAKPLDGMKDLIIVRANGAPVFHLANVVDDIDMRITHIIRGDDHVENTFRHLFLFHAMGAEPPRYAHLPMIINAQGKPYSKRDGDAYVGDFRAKGFDPDALFNYVSLLGWSPGDDREKMTRPEMIQAFTLERVHSSPAQMDMRKLTDLNGQYIAALPAEEFRRTARNTLSAQAWGGAADEERLQRVCALMQSRTKLYPDVARWRYFFDEAFEYDAPSVAKVLRKDGVGAALADLRGRLASGAFDEPAIERCLRETEKAAGIPEGKLNQPARVAVTGLSAGAGIYETMALLGRDRVLSRLDRAAALCAGA